MIRRAALALVVAGLGPVLAPLSVQKFSSRVDAIRVDVLVTDGRKPVPGLAAGDFQVLDNGVPQDIALAESERLPLAVVCAIDASDSVAGDTIEALVAAGEALLRVGDTRDRFGLLSFNHRIRMRTPLTHDPELVRRALATVYAGGRTALRDVAFASLALRPESPERALVILFSDGRDTASWLSVADVLHAARRSDAVVYAVVSTAGTSDSKVSFLKALAETTGGRIVKTSGGNGAGTFRAILDEFRGRYLLTYSPTGVSPTGWHDLRVSLNGRAGSVIARRGYFVE